MLLKRQLFLTAVIHPKIDVIRHATEYNKIETSVKTNVIALIKFHFTRLADWLYLCFYGDNGNFWFPHPPGLKNNWRLYSSL